MFYNNIIVVLLKGAGKPGFLYKGHGLTEITNWVMDPFVLVVKLKKYIILTK